MAEVISTPTYQGPDRRVAKAERRQGDRRSRFDDVPMVVDRRRTGQDRRGTSDRRSQAAMILNTRILRRRDESSPA